ncbi:cytochrome-c peroxidase [Pedobacter sp. GR22-10]|uniref:cytochrome-c peroxidase n=1 Tax=Pedobacter sp. GR22-10 TaxID=2994472 RepID=UPI0022455195|nr:cytochrome c peroxidase [Pedobacter sp. GR22-10]MCX2430061.1 cytochrome-c peroxidase [Pedobacter sp. GR22-10]
MVRQVVVFAVLMLSIALMYACSKNEDKIKPDEKPVTFSIPSNFPAPAYHFEQNKISNAGFALGKKLFYDARLSADKSVSCGSCHQQFAAFANLDHKVSHGVKNCQGKRNAPPLFNLAWQKAFFWDGGVKNIETSPLNAITDACEMGTDIQTIITFLKSTAPYPEMFKQAFGTNEISSQLLLKSLTQFTGVLVSGNSKYDQVIRKEAGVSFTAEEQSGYMLFKKKCSSCHAEPFFTDFSYRNNGLDLVSSDEGRSHITGVLADFGTFRIPSLRNIEYTGPYMHDGRFYSLDEVLEHYNSGIKAAENLDPSLKNGIQLNGTDKAQIKAFLKTLTDNEFIKNKLYSES